MTKKDLALILAVVHHGLANFAPDAVPAGKDTVMGTANAFLRYMADDKNSDQSRGK